MDADHVFVERARAGNLAAFTELTRRYQDAAFAYAVSILGDFHLAQDATQEAFVAAYRGLDRLGDPSAFPGWLRGIVRHRCHRALRRAVLSTVPLDDAFSLPGHAAARGASGNPTDPRVRAELDESRAQVLGALATLSRPHREVLTLFYLRDHSQSQIAAFLGVPVSTVNNRLHAARRILKGKVLTMVKETIHSQALPDDFAEHVGRIASVEGPVVEARFPVDSLPTILDPVGIEGEQVKGSARVVQRRPDGTVRCVATVSVSDWKTGMRIAKIPEINHVKPNREADLEQSVRLLAPPHPARLSVLDTGIKAIDVMCPLVAGGSVGIFSTNGVGLRNVLVQELINRLGNGTSSIAVFCASVRGDVSAVQDMLTTEEGYPGDVAGAVQVFWLVIDSATDPQYAAQNDALDAMIYLSPMLAVQGLWPAIDPLVSHSRALDPKVVGDEHCAVAARVRDLLARAAELMYDPVLFEHLAYRVHHRASQRVKEFAVTRLAQLSGKDRLVVTRARRLQRYLTNPFFVAETVNGIAGKSVPRQQAVQDCADILDGPYDYIPEEAFRWIGAAEEARKKTDRG